MDHALYCSKVTTKDAHYLLNVYLQFHCINRLTLQSVYEISSEWFESLQFAAPPPLLRWPLISA